MKFNLSTLLIGFVVLAAVLAFVVSPIHRTWRIESLRQHGIWTGNLYGQDSHWFFWTDRFDVKRIGTHGDAVKFSDLYNAALSFPEVERIALLRRKVTIDEIKAICGLTSITEIDLRASPIDAEMLKEILSHPHVRSLFLSDLYFTEETIDLLASSQFLQELYIDTSDLHDVDLRRLCKIPTIKRINARKSHVRDSALAELRKEFPHVILEVEYGGIGPSRRRVYR